MNRTILAEGCNFNEMKETKFLSNRVSVQCVVPLKKETAGMYALLAQIFRQGSENYPTFLELTMKLYDMYGASFGSDVEKIGDKQIVSLYVQGVDDRFAMNKEPLLKDMANLLLDTLLRPNFENGLFPSSVVDVEKQNLIELIESELNDKRRYALTKAKKLVYEGTAFGISKFGEKEDIETITPERLTEAYYKLMREATVEIFVSGGGNLNQAKEVFSKAFQGLENRAPKSSEMGVFAFQNTKKSDSEVMEISQAKLVLLYGREGTYKETNSNIMRIANTIYGASAFSKLFLNVREKKSLCYYCDSSFDRITGLLTVDSGINIKDKDLATKTIEEELVKMQQGEISDSEMTQAKLLLTNAFTALKDRLSSMEGIYLSGILLGKETTIDKQIEEVKAVTKEEVINAFQGFSLKAAYVVGPKGGDVHA